MNSTFSFQWKEEEQKSHSCPNPSSHPATPHKYSKLRASVTLCYTRSFSNQYLDTPGRHHRLLHLNDLLCVCHL